MRTPCVQVLLIMLLIVTSFSLAQNKSSSQFNITGAGARAAGMGGAFIGVADDATAIVWNPAGLTQLERMEVSSVGRYVFDNVEYSVKASPTGSESTSQTHPVFNFGSLAIPFTMGGLKVVIAAAYQRQIDLYNKQKSPTFELEETGGVDAVSPGIALGIGSVFSVGVAANIWFGNDVYSAAILPARDYTQSYDGTAKGVNYLAGALFDLSGLRHPIPLRFGACVRTPFDLDFEYALKSNPPIADHSTLDASVTHQMPLMIGLGASVQPTENLTLSVDYEMRRYGDRKTITTVKLPSPVSDTSDLSESMSGINQIRAGIEYLIVTRGGVFPLRAGYQSVPTLLADWVYASQSSIGTPGDQVIGKGYSVGTGFISGSFALDLAYSWVQYEQTATVSGQAYAGYTFKQQTVTGSLIIYF